MQGVKLQGKWAGGAVSHGKVDAGNGNIRDQCSCCSEELLCSAVTHQGQNLHNPGEGEDAVLPGKSSSALPLHLCQSNHKAQPGDPRGRDLAVTSQP